jgi:hypothetical protein
MPRSEPAAALFVTTVLSHLAIVPTVAQFYRRRWTTEAIMGAFTILASFMYHMSEDFGRSFFLDELQWHRLDNIGALNAFSMMFIYMAQIDDPFANTALKWVNFFGIVVVQEGHPWDERYTFGPLIAFALIPVLYNLLWARRVPAYDFGELGVGLASLVVALLFFVKGLDDASDAYRMAHGMWHVACGFSTLRLWRCVRHPTNTAVARQLVDVARNSGSDRRC